MYCNLYGNTCCNCSKVDIFPSLQQNIGVSPDVVKNIVKNNATCTTKQCTTPPIVTYIKK